LVIQAETDYHRPMSTAELLEQVKAMPARERRKLVEIILSLEDDTPRAASRQRVKWPDVKARARHVFGNKIMPNLVLLDREDSSS
jgi:hypothetical protein